MFTTDSSLTSDVTEVESAHPSKRSRMQNLSKKYQSGDSKRIKARVSEYIVPRWLLDEIIVISNGQVDLDPCSDNNSVNAKICWTMEENGLREPWIANSVWLHAPYSDMKSWVTKAVTEYRTGNAKQVLVLTRVDPSTSWWLELRDYPWLAFHSRLYYEGATHPTPFANALFYLGSNFPKFVSVVASHGPIYTRAEPNFFIQSTDVLRCQNCTCLLKPSNRSEQLHVGPIVGNGASSSSKKRYPSRHSPVRLPCNTGDENLLISSDQQWLGLDVGYSQIPEGWNNSYLDEMSETVDEILRRDPIMSNIQEPQ